MAAVSIIPVPLGTWISRPSTVTVTSSGELMDRNLDLGTQVRVVWFDRREHVLERRLPAERAAALVDVALVLVPELRDVARDRHRGGVAERAKALPENAVAHVEEE